MVKTYEVDDVLDDIGAIIQKCGTAKKAAKSLGISATYLNDVIHRRRLPGNSILRMLGYRSYVSYIRITKRIAPEKA